MALAATPRGALVSPCRPLERVMRLCDPSAGIDPNSRSAGGRPWAP